MSDKSLLEEIQDEELSDADAEAKFAAKLARCSDAEFRVVSSYLCRRGDQAKAAAKPEPRELSEQEVKLAALDSAEYDQFLRGIGINSRLGVTLSSAMRQERRRRAANNE